MANTSIPPTNSEWRFAAPADWVVFAADVHSREVAAQFAERYTLPFVERVPAGGVGIRVGQGFIALQEGGKARIGPVYVDLVGGALARQRQEKGFRKQPLFRALGVTQSASQVAVHVVDTTAGLGRDAARMVYAGYQVTAIERHPVVGALLENGVTRAREDAAWGALFASNFRLILGDAVNILPDLTCQAPPVDVVYLDPMFPERKKKAQVKKEMQLLQRLHGAHPADPSVDEQELLHMARQIAVKRVVVKRPPRAPAIAEDVSHCILGDTVRYDVYTRG